MPPDRPPPGIDERLAILVETFIALRDDSVAGPPAMTSERAYFLSKTPITITQCGNSVLRKATRRLGRLFDAELEPSGLKATQHALLAHVKQMSVPTMKQLADCLVMDLSALGHTLKPLIRDGYVILSSDTRDRRCKRVALTPEGEEKLDATKLLWQGAQTRFDVAFGPRKAEKLRKALTVLASDAFSEAFTGSTKVRRPGRDA